MHEIKEEDDDDDDDHHNMPTTMIPMSAIIIKCEHEHGNIIKYSGIPKQVITNTRNRWI